MENEWDVKSASTRPAPGRRLRARRASIRVVAPGPRVKPGLTLSAPWGLGIVTNNPNSEEDSTLHQRCKTSAVGLALK